MSGAAADASGQPTLVALLDGQVVGRVFQGATGQLRFVYDDEWRSRADTYPVSLSMPLAAAEHKHQAINAFLWGLLPDNTRTLDQYGRLFGVSSGNPVKLLAHIGADCPGAVQFAPPDGVDALRGRSTRLAVEWLSAADVAAELRLVREQGIPGSDRRTVGQFSLAGAQPKIALFERDGCWGRPSGRTPTNRILKPPSPDFAGFAENEHLCLDLAAELGLGAVRSRVETFEDEVAIVVDRFDRVERGNRILRVHQEDLCQALAVLPTTKYENEGGPGISAIIRLLRESSQESIVDIGRFLDATVLNWVLVGTDGHAKNYALLHGSGGRVRLAPFYDVASLLPYVDRRLHRVRLAMKIGGESRVARIGHRQWARLATQNRLSADDVLGRVTDLLQRLPDAVDLVRRRAISARLNRATITRLTTRMLERLERCQSMMGR